METNLRLQIVTNRHNWSSTKSILVATIAILRNKPAGIDIISLFFSKHKELSKTGLNNHHSTIWSPAITPSAFSKWFLTVPDNTWFVLLGTHIQEVRYTRVAFTSGQKIRTEYQHQCSFDATIPTYIHTSLRISHIKLQEPFQWRLPKPARRCEK